MVEKLKIMICTAPRCYVMGGAELQLVDEHLNTEELMQVEIKGYSCESCSTNSDGNNLPFAMVGDELLSGTTLDKVLVAVRKRLNKA